MNGDRVRSTSGDRVNRRPRPVHERAKAVSDRSADAGQAVAVERYKLCAKVVDEQRRRPPLRPMI